MKYVLLLSVLVLLIGLTFASSIDDLVDLGNELEGKELPKVAKVFNNQKINLYINKDNGEEIIVAAETKDGKFLGIKEKAHEKPTINAYASERVINEILNSDEPSDSFIRAISKSEISYRGVGFFNWIKLGIVKIISKLFG